MMDRRLGKKLNLSLVLNLVKGTDGISRAEIAAQSGLSPATISNLSAELIEEGLIYETGVVETTRGRPPILLTLNSSARYVVGVKVMPDSFVAVVTDLNAQVVAHRSVEAALMQTVEEIVSDISKLVDAVIIDAAIDRTNVLGVGLGLAGIVDSSTGVCRYTPFFGWRDVDLGRPLADLLRLNVYLENDVNSLTVAEQWFGHGRGLEHFVVVTVGRGVGSGMVINGEFYGGQEGSVGELGHVTVHPGGPICDCGRRGCLEALASDGAVLEAVEASRKAGRETTLGASPITLADVIVAADGGDQLAQEALAEAGRWLGVGLSVLVNLLNPEMIIVAGEGVEAGGWRLDPMRQALVDNQYDSLGSKTQIVVESAGDITWARGAACVVLSEFFRSPIHRGRPVAVAGGS
jgi:predicted NBD/HSP70 family sugar kinase